MYSSESTAAGSTHPEPVVVIAARVPRSNPPARARSSTASRARCSAVGADSRPEYARTGDVATAPEKAAMSAGDGPVPAKVRPCCPSDTHGTSDPGPPDRSGPAGCTTPSSVVEFRTEKALSAAATRPSSSTPLTSRAVPATTATQPTARAARGPIHRPSNRADHR